MTGAWLIDAAELLAEPDPGPTPYLVENLIVDQAIVAVVGRWKTTKSYGLLELCISIATGEPAFGKLAVPRHGPVVYVCEESGRAALWRRLDALCRGRAIDRDRLAGRLLLGANARVKLDDPRWQRELVEIGRDVSPRLIAFDPLARMKASSRDENPQVDMAPLLEYVRVLRDETRSAVGFVHHTGHNGSHMRGTSDLESVWETRLQWEREGQSAEITVTSEHREAEAGEPIRYRIQWDHDTRTMRFPLVEDDTLARVREYLADDPDASGNTVFKELGGNRKAVLAAVRQVRESGTEPEYHAGTTPLGLGKQGGTREGLVEAPGTTTAQPPLVPVPNGKYRWVPPALDNENGWRDDPFADVEFPPFEDDVPAVGRAFGEEVA